jgi:hypothetical protein
MQWQLNREFSLQSHSFSEQLLVYHYGSGMTHCLSGHLALLFQLFNDRPAHKIDLDEIHSQFNDVDNIESLLRSLKTMYLIHEV